MKNNDINIFLSESTIKKNILYFSILLFSFPRFIYPSIPFAITSLDFCLIPLMLGLFLSLITNPTVRWPQNIPLYFVLIPICLFASNLMPFFISGNQENLIRGTLQALRRLPPAILLLFLLQTKFSPRELLKLFKIILISTIAGGFLFLLLVHDIFQPLSAPIDLMGNPISIILKLLNFEKFAQIVTNYRFAGNTGSPTTYGVICSILLLILLDVFRRRLVSSRLFYSCSFLLFILLFATAAKAVLPIFLIIYIFSLLKLRSKGSLIIFSLSLICIFGISTGLLNEVLSPFLRAGSESSSARVDLYQDGINKLTKDFSIFLFGEGWRTQEYGWHNELFEIIMGFGVPFGLIIVFIQYVYLPYKIYKIKIDPNSFFSKKTLLACYVVILFSSMFQDIFHDANILFILIVLWFILIGANNWQFQLSKAREKCNETRRDN